MCTKGCNQGGSGLKAEDVTIYKEIQRNTNMAMKAIETISDKVFDEELAMQISRQSLRYSDICNEATKQLVTAKADTYQGSRFADIMLKTGIHYNTLLNTSTSHIAELMIKGSNMGSLEMHKVLQHNDNAGERSVGLARQLLDFEAKNVERLITYL